MAAATQLFSTWEHNTADHTDVPQQSTMGETSETFEPTAEDLKILRAWIQQSPHIPNDYDDNFLTSFFRGCKGSLQKTKIVLENYCSLGARLPEMYGGLDPLRKQTKEFLDVAYFVQLPKKTDDDCMILFNALPSHPTDPYKHCVLEVFQLQLMSLILSINEGKFGSGKVIIISDCKGLSLTHMRDMTPTVLTSWAAAMEKSLPYRIQGIHALNVPAVVEWVFTLIKKVVKQKIAQRIFIHSQQEGVLKHIPKKFLPEEYGGTEPPIKELFEDWRKKLEKKKDLFVNEDKKLRALDHLRPKEANDGEMVGSFKKLSVD